MRSPREPTSLPFLPFLLFWEEERRLQERNETQADRARVEGERGGNKNKIKKSGGFTPLVVIPWVGGTPLLSFSVSVPFSVSACWANSPSTVGSCLWRERQGSLGLLCCLSLTRSLFSPLAEISAAWYIFFKPSFFPSPYKRPPSGQKRKASWVLLNSPDSDTGAIPLLTNSWGLLLHR